MIVELSAQTIIATAGVVSGLAFIGGTIAAVIRFVDRQKAQDKEIKAMKEEQTIIVFGMLACLKGLKEQGCNGPVTEAIAKIEKHLNEKAHH